MQKIRTIDELREAIRDLEHQNYVNEQQMRQKVADIADRLKPINLVKGLFSNLVIAPSSNESDQQSLAKFAKGLQLANRARQLALSAVPTEVAAVRLTSKNVKVRKRASRRKPK